MACRSFFIRAGLVSSLVLALTLALSCMPTTPPLAGPTYQTVFNELASGLLSVSGSAPDHIYAVGTDAGDGGGPVILHYDGTAWTRLNTGAEGDLWWITAVPVDGDFYVSGEGGLILRLDPETETFERQTTPGTETIFGLWGFARDNIWAVGGSLENQQFGGTIWHFDGTSWTVQDLTGQFPDGYPTAFKIWARNPNEMYVTGAVGLILRFDGTTWTQVPNGTTRNPTLFSVYGNADTVAAVGGFNSGVILEKGTGDFADLATPGTLQMNGVFINPDGSGVAVGRELNFAFRTSGGWEVQDTGLSTNFDFHACWIDSDGGVWAVGGVLIAEPITRGTLVYYGTQTVSSDIAP